MHRRQEFWSPAGSQGWRGRGTPGARVGFLWIGILGSCLLLVALLSASPSFALMEWNRYATGGRTWGREGHAFAYDSARECTVRFGGYGYEFNIFLADTWEWNGTAWMQRLPVVSPPARAYHGMVYDSARGRVVLFGGWNGGDLGDTWEWDGTTWTQRLPSVSPPARAYLGMAYDSARARVVLFGGDAGGLSLNDTWEWDGTEWMQRSSAAVPPARGYHAMAYDRARARVVLFGGDAGGLSLNDTWEWDGNQWIQRLATVSPPARYAHALAYDSLRRRVVLVGGMDPNDALLDDTWEWDGSDWVAQLPIPWTARAYHAMAYDEARVSTLVSGGMGWQWDELWGYDPVLPRPVPLAYLAWGDPMTARRNGAYIDLTWDVSNCTPSPRYNVFAGVLGDFRMVTEAICDLPPTGEASILLAGENVWWIVVGANEGLVGSFGGFLPVGRELNGWEGMCATVRQSTAATCP